ncbi:MAG: hypothetical protein AAF198_08970 [Pseudomonadota bacterium]
MQSENAGNDPSGSVQATRTLLNIARDDLVAFLQELRADDGMKERLRGYNDILTSLKKAAQQSIEAEAQLAKFGSSVQPIGNSKLDLEGARRDVLERLARIANARDD